MVAALEGKANAPSISWGSNVIPAVPIVLIGSAFLVLTINIVLTAPEVVRKRVAVPTRVREEDAAAAPPPEIGPTNPWDQPG